MRPFGIVVSQILGNLFLPELEVFWDALDAFLLDGPVEAFEMGIVVRRSNSRVSMRQSTLQYFFRKPF